MTHAPPLALVAGTFTLALAPTAPTAQQLIPDTVDVDGVTREYLTYLPTGYDGTTDLPVLINYHGGSDTMMGWLLANDMRPLADANDFILVYPQGLPEEPGGATIWNSVGPFSNGVDEIGFTSDMIDALDQDYAVDLSRVYACGYSNGANLCWELACFLSDRITAVAPVAGSMWTWTEDLCTPTRPVPLMSIHGTLDFYNPWSGGPPFSLGLLDASQYWVQNAMADTVPTITPLPNLVPGDGSTVELYTWGNGTDCITIQHFKVVNGGHDWPGAWGNMDIDSNTEIWNFVSQYDMDGLIGCGCSITATGVGAGGANIGTLASPSTPLLGSNLQFDLAGFNGAGTGLLVLGLAPQNQAALGGTILVDVNSSVGNLPIATGAGGSGGVAFGIPTDPLLVGLTGYAQAVISDGSQPAGWAFSNGLAITLCD